MSGDEELEEFLADAGLAQEIPSEPEPKKQASTRKVSRSLQRGQIENVEITPETAEQPTVKLMKVVTITRLPEHRIASFELTNSEGRDFNLTIDEATARAIAAIFD